MDLYEIYDKDSFDKEEPMFLRKTENYLGKQHYLHSIKDKDGRRVLIDSADPFLARRFSFNEMCKMIVSEYEVSGDYSLSSLSYDDFVTVASLIGEEFSNYVVFIPQKFNAYSWNDSTKRITQEIVANYLTSKTYSVPTKPKKSEDKKDSSDNSLPF